MILICYSREVIFLCCITPHRSYSSECLMTPCMRKTLELQGEMGLRRQIQLTHPILATCYWISPAFYGSVVWYHLCRENLEHIKTFLFYLKKWYSLIPRNNPLDIWFKFTLNNYITERFLSASMTVKLFGYLFLIEVFSVNSNANEFLWINVHLIIFHLPLGWGASDLDIL